MYLKWHFLSLFLQISRITALLIGVTYCLFLFFQLYTHIGLFKDDDEGKHGLTFYPRLTDTKTYLHRMNLVLSILCMALLLGLRVIL